ncbi:MAG: metal-dependent hydrolase [Candidatus Lokiarchaeota archaeon]|nr:metal-dependent hydrolase [Candidatus Lokiarchaeota archaeon]
MPFTPYHFGPALFIGLVLLNVFDFLTFLIANIILDIEGFLVLFLNLDYPLHGFFHSFLGSSIVAVLLSLIMLKLRKYFTPFLSSIKIKQEISNKKIFFGAFIGIYFHIFLDSFLYTDIKPFFPSNYNPLLQNNSFTMDFIYNFCGWCFLGTLIIYLTILFLHYKKENNLKVRS